MRDLIAGLIALALLIVAASLATTLHHYRRRRQRASDSERALGRRVIAEIPTGDELTLFSEDDVRFYYGDKSIDRDLILAARVLINGSPIAAVASERAAPAALHQASFEDRQEGLTRDRWDVAIDTERGMVLVECGAIREHVSQDLARNVFAAVKASIESRPTTPSRRSRPAD